MWTIFSCTILLLCIPPPQSELPGRAGAATGVDDVELYHVSPEAT